MDKTANKLVDIARAELGYKEKKSNSQLDDPLANSGSGNWTKYARDLHSAGFYNGNKNGYAWCSVFVDWCFYQLCDRDKAETERVNCQTGKLGATCTYSANYYKAQGRFDMTPRPGDQVYFKKAGSTGSCHTGIVESVDNDYIYTIEGNSSDCVKRNKYKRNYSNFYGFGHPKYDYELDPTDIPVIPEKTDPSVKKVNVSLRKLSSGCNGHAVKQLQFLLYSTFDCNLEVDGKFGPKTLEVVKSYQKSRNLAVDGVVGPATWSSLINGE